MDFKVADLTLADYGRTEITLAEHEMPGLMAMRERYGDAQAARRRPDRRLAAHDHPDRRPHRDAGRARRRGPLGLLQHLLHPGPRRRRGRRRPRRHRRRTRRASRSSPGRARPWRSTGGAPSRSSTGPATSCPNMILDDGGDATLLVHLGVQAEKAGKAPTRRPAHEHRAAGHLRGAQRRRSPRTATAGPRSPTRSRASPRRPPPACTASTSMMREGSLLFPAINVNDSVTKSQVRQQVRLPPLADRRHQPRHRRAHRRQGRGRLRLRRRRQGLRGVAARPGRPRHRHRDRPDLRAAGGDGRLPGRHPRRGPRRSPTSSSPRPATRTSSPSSRCSG